MNLSEQISRHKMALPFGYLPQPQLHLHNYRDRQHYEYTCYWLSQKQCSTVLDIGCFDGWLDFLVLTHGFKVTGVEIVPELAAAANQFAAYNHLPYSCLCGSLDTVNAPISDAVLCFEVLEHVPFEEVPDWISRINALATKLCLVSLPNQRHELNPQHFWTPTEEVIERLFRPYNHQVEYVTYPGTTIPGNWMIRWTK